MQSMTRGADNIKFIGVKSQQSMTPLSKACKAQQYKAIDILIRCCNRDRALI